MVINNIGEVTFEQGDQVAFVNANNVIVPQCEVVKEFLDEEGITRVMVKYKTMLENDWAYANPTKNRVGYY